MASRYLTIRAVLAAELGKPYVLGRSDCFALGCRLADALDPALDLGRRYLGSYSTLAGARRALFKRGFSSIAALLGAHLEPCGPAEARVGDLAVLSLSGAEHVGVCTGAGFVTKTERGRQDHPVGAAVAAFRTGPA